MGQWARWGLKGDLPVGEDWTWRRKRISSGGKHPEARVVSHGLPPLRRTLCWIQEFSYVTSNLLSTYLLWGIKVVGIWGSVRRKSGKLNWWRKLKRKLKQSLMTIQEVNYMTCANLSPYPKVCRKCSFLYFFSNNLICSFALHSSPCWIPDHFRSFCPIFPESASKFGWGCIWLLWCLLYSSPRAAVTTL